MIFGEGFRLKLTDFSDFRNAVQIFADRKSSLDRWKIYNSSYRIEDISSIVVDEYNRLYITLPSGETIRITLYINRQKLPDHFLSGNIFPENLNRYHIYKCPLVENLFRYGNRVVATAKRDGGFHYQFLNPSGKLMSETNNQHLYICRQCLLEFNRQHNTNYTDEDFYPSLYFDN